MKVTEIIWNTKFQLSFQSSSAAALIKKLSDGNTINFCGTSGHPLWIRANYRRFRQRAVEKSPPKRPVSKLPNFYRATFLQQGCQTCIRCAQKYSSRYKLHSENEIISTEIGLKAEIVSKFQKKVTEFEQKLFGSVFRTEIFMSNCLFCGKYISEAIIYFRKSPGF